jgi:hypothetical protein
MFQGGHTHGQEETRHEEGRQEESQEEGSPPQADVIELRGAVASGASRFEADNLTRGRPQGRSRAFLQSSSFARMCPILIQAVLGRIIAGRFDAAGTVPKMPLVQQGRFRGLTISSSPDPLLP